jgi:hypothetical protein
MPNHVMNKWKISHIPQDKLQYILDKLTMITEEGNRIIDFDLIIPEPRLKKDCPADCIVNKDSHVMEEKDRPWFDWYTWRNKYWNTKWGAYDGYTHTGKTYIIMYFQTAWSFAGPVAMKLAELGYDLDLQWADEDWGSNCGRLQYDPNTKEWTRWSLDELKPNPNAWARRLWNDG